MPCGMRGLRCGRVQPVQSDLFAPRRNESGPLAVCDVEQLRKELAKPSGETVAAPMRDRRWCWPLPAKPPGAPDR